VTTADNGFAALEILNREAMSIVLADLKMPRMDGLTLFKSVREEIGEIPFIIMTAFASVQTALDSIKAGVFDYIPKPFHNDQVLVTVEQALSMYRVQLQNQALRQEMEKNFGKELIGQSPAHKKLIQEIAQVAQAPSPVLITGETGVGKELVAKTLHRAGSRSTNPWVAINCAALTETLLESEIFGHERGAFTGALERKKGLVEVADGGTLFLDEIGELSMAFQAKLLRFLQEKTFRRVGGAIEISSNIRILAATNRDLQSMVEQGTFRQDLLFRIRVIELRVPPLQKRREDIPLLAVFLLKKTAEELGRSMSEISPEAMACLEAYSWPGNIRELRNAIERGILFSTTNILEVEALPGEIRSIHAAARPLPAYDAELSSKDFSLPIHLETVEREIIRQALIRSQGIQARAATLLGISRSNLQYKLKKLRME
jgi:DNA-binding NtrC family response regulator